MKYPVQFFILFIMFAGYNTCAGQKQPPVLQWKLACELPPNASAKLSPGIAGPLAGIHADKLVIAGGSNFPEGMPWDGGKKIYCKNIYVFEKENGKMHLTSSTEMLTEALAYTANVSTDSGIICMGGENEKGISDQVMLLRYNTHTSKVDLLQYPKLPVATTNASACVASNLVFVAGGETNTWPTNGFYVLNLADRFSGWKKLTSLPIALSHAVLMAMPYKNSHHLYLAGGRSKQSNGLSTFFSKLYVFKLETNEWQELNELPYPLAAGTGVAIDDNKMLLFGGDKGETFHKVEKLLVAIAGETDTLRRQQLIAQKNQLQKNHPGFSRQVLQYDVLSNTWSNFSTLPFETPVTTTALLNGRSIILPCGEIRAGVRTPKIWSAKLEK